MTASSWEEIFGEYDPYMSGPRSGTFRKCKSCGDMHALQAWPHNCMTWEPDNRCELNVSTNFISDSLESLGGLNGVQCQASGIHFTSKKKMRNEYRARGMVEMGNDKPGPRKVVNPDRKAIRETIQRAASMVENEGATAANFRARKKERSAMGRIA